MTGDDEPDSAEQEDVRRAAAGHIAMQIARINKLAREHQLATLVYLLDMAAPEAQNAALGGSEDDEPSG